MQSVLLADKCLDAITIPVINYAAEVQIGAMTIVFLMLAGADGVFFSFQVSEAVLKGNARWRTD